MAISVQLISDKSGTSGKKPRKRHKRMSCKLICQIN